jgi:abortive infection bacteriophage resistance protein
MAKSPYAKPALSFEAQLQLLQSRGLMIQDDWIHSIVYLRNVCAHHTRLWNRVMRIQPVRPSNPTKVWLLDSTVSNRQCYFMFSIVCFLLETVNPGHHFKQRLSALFSKYPQVDKRAMGFPDNWEIEPLWK